MSLLWSLSSPACFPPRITLGAKAIWRLFLPKDRNLGRQQNETNQALKIPLCQDGSEPGLLAVRMYEPRGDEGYSCLQKMPVPGSISGLESELSSSVTRQAGLDKQPLLPQRPPQRSGPDPQVSCSLALPPAEWGQSQGHQVGPLSGLDRLGQDVTHPFPSRPEGCFPNVPRGKVTRVSHQNSHDQAKGKVGKENPTFQIKDKQVKMSSGRRAGEE